MIPVDHCAKCGWDRIKAEHQATMAERERCRSIVLAHIGDPWSSPEVAMLLQRLAVEIYGTPESDSDSRARD